MNIMMMRYSWKRNNIFSNSWLDNREANQDVVGDGDEGLVGRWRKKTALSIGRD